MTASARSLAQIERRKFNFCLRSSFSNESVLFVLCMENMENMSLYREQAEAFAKKHNTFWEKQQKCRYCKYGMLLQSPEQH